MPAAPVGGQADAALAHFLATLNVPRSAVQIGHGAAGREQRLLIVGLDRAIVRRRLGRSAG